MTDAKRFRKEYRQADHDKRLLLFLECPSLRDAFMSIEQNEASGQERYEAHPATAGRSKE
ncbi:MAG: hypothetical protein SWQ30_10645 [Thermodesulfobacteriota bacterium]|nr:hypothetical protein [Thermodesulfobacteriota bacterium]